MTVYEKIDSILKAQKKSRRWLAQQLEIPQTTLQSMFSRESTLKVEFTEKIANILGVPFRDLLPNDLAAKLDNYEGLADDIRQEMMETAYTPEEYEEARNTKISDIQAQLLFSEMERERLNRIHQVFLNLNNVGQKKALDQVEDLAKIPEYQKDKDDLKN